MTSGGRRHAESCGDPSEDSATTFTDFSGALREEVLAPSSLDAISQELRAGNVCVIRNAFREAVAERVWACLDRFDAWRPYQTHARYFAMEGHGILEEDEFPSTLTECRRIFASAASRQLIASLTGQACDGALDFNPTLHLPGDHLTPHSDAILGRKVGFIWHLTKGWQPEWGGQLIWCHPMTKIIPTFNTLILFRVVPDGYHLITPVSRHAKGKRLSILGWWTPNDVQDVSVVEPAGEWCQQALRAVGPEVFAFGDQEGHSRRCK